MCGGKVNVLVYLLLRASIYRHSENRGGDECSEWAFRFEKAIFCFLKGGQKKMLYDREERGGKCYVIEAKKKIDE